LLNIPAGTFHLQPARRLYRLNPNNGKSLSAKNFEFAGKHILLLDSPIRLRHQRARRDLDLLIISKNPGLSIMQLDSAFNLGQVVIDASVPPGRARLWQQQCLASGIPCHNTREKGAFVMNLR
jgi:competence protein ComEC